MALILSLQISASAHDSCAAAQQMSVLVGDLLSYTEVISEPLDASSYSDLQHKADRAIEKLCASIAEAGAEISVGVLPSAPIEPGHAELLFLNLIGNSLRYRRRDLPLQIRISAEQVSGKLIIAIADNGIGREPAYHQQIFGIFNRLHTRADYPGTGLGLAICRRIIERYGGSIWVDSEVGAGSRFRFSLPDRSSV